VKLETIVTALSEHYGWESLGQQIDPLLHQRAQRGVQPGSSCADPGA
jgi:hypothetical protein